MLQVSLFPEIPFFLVQRKIIQQKQKKKLYIIVLQETVLCQQTNLVIEKADEGNLFVKVEKVVKLRNIERKFEKVSIKKGI